MPKSPYWENALLALFFQNVGAGSVGDAGGLPAAGTAGQLWLSLHNNDPAGSNLQTTFETSYGGYTRVPVARTGGGWGVSGGTASPAVDVVFPTCVGPGTDTVTHFGVGSDSTGFSVLLYSGPVVPSLFVDLGVAPVLEAASTITES